MALKVVPFGASEGFSDLPIVGTHFHSQGFTPTLFGMAAAYSMVNKASSAGIPGLGEVRHQVTINGFLYVQDDSGQIWKEGTKGAYNLSRVRNPGGNGAGLLADQYGNLYYACGSTNNQLGKFDGAVWNDTYQSLQSTQHPMDWYEGTVFIADNDTVDAVFSDGSWSNSAFTLPSQMTIVGIRSGPAGVLIGANKGSRAAIILWDGISPRSKVPWKWVPGQILAIEPYGENWLVKTDRQVWITNGITVKEFFGIFDDPLALNPYTNGDVLPQQMSLVNDVLFFIINNSVGDLTQYGKKKPGLYLYFLTRKAWSYIPVATGATFNVNVNSIITDLANNRISVAYSNGGVNYLAQLINQPPTTAQFTSEELGLGRIKYQRVFFGPTDKTLEGIVLNLSILNSTTEHPTLSFNVSVKAYNFKRQLWGHAVTSAQLTNHNQVQVDWTVTGTAKAQVGDEVTILEGSNAGFIAHITAIANQGLTNETWTLDLTAANATEAGMNLQVQPFTLIKRQSFTTLSELKNLFFSVNSIKGKQFLVKVVLDGIPSTLSLEVQTSYFVFNDIGYDQT
ncbi:MAG TPA: hypothetical protein VKB38_13245 [Terracidiphilus sp.]|nr:hypothetical protein [Terracidiphilus sp.]